jgi:hypothetical protein
MSKFCTVMRAASCIAGKPRAVIIASVTLPKTGYVVVGEVVIVDNQIAASAPIRMPASGFAEDLLPVREALREFETVVEVVRQESESAWAQPDAAPQLVYQVADNQEKTLWRDTTEDEYNRTGTIWRRVAYVQPKADPVGNLPEAVAAWFEAEVARREAVRIYNERVKYVRRLRDEGQFPGPDVNSEYQAMEAAKKTTVDLLAPMYEALAGSLPASK